MIFNENEKCLMKVFHRYHTRVAHIRRIKKNENIRVCLQALKWGFTQEFMASLVDSKIKPSFGSMIDEIKHWARLYRIHQSSPFKWRFRNNTHRNHIHTK